MLTDTQIEQRNALVVRYRPLVYHFVNQYRGCRVDRDDLAGAGMEGLLIAAEKYDPTIGTSFITYASGWIKSKIRGEIMHMQNNVPYPNYYHWRVLGQLAINNQTEICDDSAYMGTGQEPEDEIMIRNLDSYLKLLPPRNREILKNRFGLNGYQRETYRQIAQKNNICHERVRQIVDGCLEQLQHWMMMNSAEENRICTNQNTK